MPNNNLNGINITKATKIFTAKSPKESVTQGIPDPYNEIDKNNNVSTLEPINEEASGAINHFFCLN